MRHSTFAPNAAPIPRPSRAVSKERFSFLLIMRLSHAGRRDETGSDKGGVDGSFVSRVHFVFFNSVSIKRLPGLKSTPLSLRFNAAALPRDEATALDGRPGRCVFILKLYE